MPDLDPSTSMLRRQNRCGEASDLSSRGEQRTVGRNTTRRPQPGEQTGARRLSVDDHNADTAQTDAMPGTAGNRNVPSP